MNKRSSFSTRLAAGVSAVFLLSFLACTSGPPPTPKDLAQEALVPMPAVIEATGSSFALTASSAIYTDGSGPEVERIAQFLADILKPSTGFDLNLQSSAGTPGKGNIYLHLTDDAQLGAEGYLLTITKDLVQLAAKEPAGLFRGVQTIRQLLPGTIEQKEVQNGPWEIASGTIRDVPDYAYRGAMLDVARHFFSVTDVKRYLDYLALYKLNSLHLHLSDDQGWRIEIKSWPELTAKGGSTEVGGTSGGFYTQEDYADIVAYAAERYITIVPEIDMPGHTNAALAAYPELNCDGKPRELYTGTEVGFSTLCTSSETTYQFVDDVVREISAITPGPYFHIGGDESHVTPLEDYIPFVNRVQEIVIKYGKQVIGWDEIAHASLQPNTVVQYWAEAENAVAGVAQGAKVLMSPARKVYLDMQYDTTTPLGLHWAAYIEVDSSYLWKLETIAKGISKENILGIEAPLWTETITELDELEYMVFPRLVGLAEIGWTSPEKRNWENYRQRLAGQQGRFEAMGIDFYASKQIPWPVTETEIKKD